MTMLAAHASRHGRFGRFTLHLIEMCAPMCIGFAIGDLIYFWIGSRFGYSRPFTELPELSLAVVTLSMTTPMVGWMLYRGMPRREIAEMAVAMPSLAVALLVLGWVSLLPMSDLAAWEHGLMMPAMLVPMFLRLDFYTSKHGHHASAAAPPSSRRWNAHGR